MHRSIANRVIQLVALFSLQLLLAGLAFAEEAFPPPEPVPVSIIELIADKATYHGKLVRLKGYLVLGFEHNAIYLSKEDSKRGITKNGLWVGFASELLSQTKLRSFSGTWVAIEGTFDKDNKGHLGLCSGSVLSITKIRKL